MPEDGYGWEKLFSERMCRHFREDFGLATRVARYHNVYGPVGTYEGGREKAPAAVCRKVITAKLSGNHEIEIWGDGHQTRSFMYIDDCVHGTNMLLDSDFIEPINIGSSQKVTINQLVDIAEEIAGIKLKRRYKLDAPKGVNGRNSDNTLIKKVFNWEPSIKLEDWARAHLQVDLRGDDGEALSNFLCRKPNRPAPKPALADWRAQDRTARAAGQHSACSRTFPADSNVSTRIA